MLKFMFTFDKGRMAAWLNRLAEEGLGAVRAYGPFVVCEPCSPGEYEYAVDVSSTGFRVPESYREHMRDFGIEVQSVWGPWVLLRKKTADGPLELYTDDASLAEEKEKMFRFFRKMCLWEFLCTAVLLISAAVHFHWAALFLAAFGGCAGTAMAVRAYRLYSEERVLEQKDAPHDDLYAARGLALALAGLLLLAAGALPLGPESLQGFLCGMGSTLSIVGCIQLFCERRSAR